MRIIALGGLAAALLTSACQPQSAGTVAAQPAYPYVRGAPTRAAAAPRPYGRFTPAPVPPGTPSPGTPPKGPARRSFTVVASGDVLLHDPVTAQARRDGGGTLDYREILSGVRPIVSAADLAICHLETPLGPPGGPFHGYPDFSVPPQVVPALRDTGYDECSTASNHTLDQGAAGVSRTLADLDAAGIGHAGSARSAAEAARPKILDVRGVRVAHLSYAYGLNGFHVPPGRPYLVNVIDAGRILAAAHAARKAGAEVVIVSLHWGTEYDHRPNPQQVSLARRLLASPDIDLIIGHHAHVVQPFARASNGKWVAYGLGNLVAAQHGEDRAEGLIARFTFTRGKDGWKVSRAEFVPTYIDPGPPLRVVDVPAALASPGLTPRRRAFLQGVQDRTSRIVFSRAALPALAG